MVCIQCGQKTKVMNSRLQKRSNQTWRRRSCLSCGAIFSTLEAADYGAGWLVQGKSGFHPFNRDRLFLSLYETCKHRPEALSDAAALTDTVIRKLQPSVERGTLQTTAIIHTAQVTLKRFDTAASLLYNALHQR
jgi:transcriptional repressor NrdR